MRYVKKKIVKVSRLRSTRKLIMNRLSECCRCVSEWILWMLWKFANNKMWIKRYPSRLNVAKTFPSGTAWLTDWGRHYYRVSYNWATTAAVIELLNLQRNYKSITSWATKLCKLCGTVEQRMRQLCPTCAQSADMANCDPKKAKPS